MSSIDTITKAHNNDSEVSALAKQARRARDHKAHMQFLDE
jgi:hypothetical protein